eukprot:c24353_g1_i1.p1 GENE.c24353_g1_i1~~c24353_g1_i1.p1  ORF type:complete len:118 (+),score=30.48 c24353_g1_i1:44-355(+)
MKSNLYLFSLLFCSLIFICNCSSITNQRKEVKQLYPQTLIGGTHPIAPGFNPFKIPPECMPGGGNLIMSVSRIDCVFKPPWLWVMLALYIAEQDKRYGPTFSI